MIADRYRPAFLAGAALVLCMAALGLFWPGVALYDTVAQYRQVVSGQFDDWHPPIMARLWRVMLVLQMALYWGGLGLLASALTRTGKTGCGVAVLGIGAMPLFLGWQGTVLKDAQMLGAMLAAVGVVSWWRLRALRVPGWAWLLVAVLMGYATLVRANAVFATVALIVMLVGPRDWWARGVVALVGVGADQSWSARCERQRCRTNRGDLRSVGDRGARARGPDRIVRSGGPHDCGTALRQTLFLGPAR
jgi:hypothetical protein